MSTLHTGIFLRARRAMKKKIVSFGNDGGGAIAVEMAFILPIFMSMAFLIYDAGTVYTQYKRGTRHYYAMGDVLSAQTQNITCSQLDKMAELVYASYENGNWARRPRPSGDDFNENGALDFRFVVRMMNVKDIPAPDGNGTQVRGEVQWVYFRTPNDMDTPSEKKPGDFMKVPNGLRIPGLNYVHINGRLFIAPKLNYLGIFDYHPATNQTHKQVPVNRYFPLRFIPNLNLAYSDDDPLTEKCWTKGVTYPPSS